MINLFWRGVAAIVSKPKVADYLIRRAMKTPFSHLPSNEDPSYMARYWLFNPYPESSKDRSRWQFPWSIRIHHIKRADNERDMHDHPWNARTIILKGAYKERRFADEAVRAMIDHPEGSTIDWSKAEAFEYFTRYPGSTAKIEHNEYHTITKVTTGGTWTMFISGPWLGDWGFLREGKKVWWRTYLAEEQRKNEMFAEMMTNQAEPTVKHYVFDGDVEALKSKVVTLGPLGKFMANDPVPADDLVDLRSRRSATFVIDPVGPDDQIRKAQLSGGAKNQIKIDNIRASFPQHRPPELVPNNEVKFPPILHIDSSSGERVIDDCLNIGEPIDTPSCVTPIDSTDTNQ